MKKTYNPTTSLFQTSISVIVKHRETRQNGLETIKKVAR